MNEADFPVKLKDADYMVMDACEMNHLLPLLCSYGHAGVWGVSAVVSPNTAQRNRRSPVFRYAHIHIEAEEGVLLVA